MWVKCKHRPGPTKHTNLEGEEKARMPFLPPSCCSLPAETKMTPKGGKRFSAFSIPHFPIPSSSPACSWPSNLFRSSPAKNQVRITLNTGGFWPRLGTFTFLPTSITPPSFLVLRSPPSHHSFALLMVTSRPSLWGP